MNFVELPSPLPALRVWAAQTNVYSFVITLEQQQPPDPDWSGYTASWKLRSLDTRPALPGYGGTQPANRIDGGPWPSFTLAVAACQAKLRELTRGRS